MKLFIVMIHNVLLQCNSSFDITMQNYSDIFYQAGRMLAIAISFEKFLDLFLLRVHSSFQGVERTIVIGMFIVLPLCEYLQQKVFILQLSIAQ